MEVVIPARAMGFDFNSARSSPCSSIPSTPKRFGDYNSLSAPTSPARISEFYREFENFLINDSGRDSFPFDWEEMPGTPRSPKKKNDVAAADDDFAFDFSLDLEKNSVYAEELFDGGVIRPSKPPPRLQVDDSSKTTLLSPRSPRSPKEIIRNVFSPRRNKVSDPLAAAAEKTSKQVENERGRDRVAGFQKNSSRRGSRSLSPYRVSQREEEEAQKPHQQQQQALAKQSQVNSNSILTSSSSSSSSSKSFSGRWRLKDFLLFRSSSEGRASDRDPLRKYSALSRKQEDVKTSSFRSNDVSGSGSGSKRRGRVSAHELHYTKNKAAAEDLKRRTYLPYKTGILGVLGFS